MNSEPEMAAASSVRRCVPGSGWGIRSLRHVGATSTRSRWSGPKRRPTSCSRSKRGMPVSFTSREEKKYVESPAIEAYSCWVLVTKVSIGLRFSQADRSSLITPWLRKWYFHAGG